MRIEQKREQKRQKKELIREVKQDEIITEWLIIFLIRTSHARM